MSKLHRTSAPPAGADLPLRNTRLYGGREEQIATASLRARGCPNPDRAYVGTRNRHELARERELSGHVRHLQAAQVTMLEAQRAVRAARLSGRPTAELAVVARSARAAYLRLSGGVEAHAVSVAESADRGW